jgi:hypothetical protein
MLVTEAQQTGFALAATIARDSGARRAHVGLAPDVSDLWCGLARDLEGLSKAERRQRIRQLAQMPRPAAVATSSVVRRVQPSRPGYVPSPQLLTMLARIARRSGPA